MVCGMYYALPNMLSWRGGRYTAWYVLCGAWRVHSTAVVVGGNTITYYVLSTTYIPISYHAYIHTYRGCV